MKQLKNKIGVITVNFNNAADTAACVNSFIGEKGTELAFYVVDNGSQTKDRDLLKKLLKQVEIIYSQTNLGFAGGNNLGINKAVSDGCTHILLINNDAVLASKNFLGSLLQIKGDIVSPVVEFVQNGKRVFDHGGKIDWLFGRNTHLNAPTQELPKEYTADYYSGVCLLIKSKVFKKIGLLDQKYFLYYEDVDFCLRAKDTGFSLKHSDKAKIIHQLSASANKFGPRKLRILSQSHLRFCLRHLSAFALPLYLSFNLYLRLKAFWLGMRSS